MCPVTKFTEVPEWERCGDQPSCFPRENVNFYLRQHEVPQRVLMAPSCLTVCSSPDQQVDSINVETVENDDVPSSTANRFHMPSSSL